MCIRVIVCVKQVMDTRVSLQIVEGKNLVLQREPHPVYLMNPADGSALEKAMTLKERLGAEVIAVTLGPSSAEETLRVALARGADKGIHILCSQGMTLDPWTTAVILREEIKKRRYDLVICGDKSLDDGGGQVGPALAELLDLPQITRVIALEVQTGHRSLIAQRLLERGDREIVESPLPALISVTAPTNEPRYVSVHRRMLVRDNLVERHELSSLDVSPEQLCQRIAVGWPRPRPKKIAMPDTTMSAAERIDFLVSGGRTEKSSGVFEGSPEEAADRIIELLQERGFL